MKHMFWEWKMDLLLLPSLSVSSSHSQCDTASLGVRYQVDTARNTHLYFLIIYGMCS